MERNFHSRWGELDLIAVKINESDYENEMYFDETAERMNADATMGQGNGVHFVDAIMLRWLRYNRGCFVIPI